MHKITVLTLGSKNFNTSLEELKDYLNFELISLKKKPDIELSDDYNVLLIHEEYLKKDNKMKKELLRNSNKIKILASNSKKDQIDFFNDSLHLPMSIKDLNQCVENSLIKKNFVRNSSIKIKNYILNKNEKKLIKNNNFILLTEKEVQLLELLMHSSTPIGKSKILKEVWKYAPEADTHTVETHIYRLRKKIKSIFFDENFILNNKDGYLL
jgi:DNA-binding response OmpR family regulator